MTSNDWVIIASIVGVGVASFRRVFKAPPSRLLAKNKDQIDDEEYRAKPVTGLKKIAPLIAFVTVVTFVFVARAFVGPDANVMALVLVLGLIACLCVLGLMRLLRK
jgi:hypothetical protein